MSWTNNWEDQNLKQVSGVFDSPVKLESLLIILDQHNMGKNVSILMSDKTRDSYKSSYSYDGVECITTLHMNTGNNFDIKEQSKAPEGSTAGSITGGVLGSIIGGLTMAGSLFIPGVNLLVTGPIIGALTGGAIGTATGGLLGALVGAGIPEHEARIFEKSLEKEGRSLVVVHVPSDQVNEVRKLFEQCGAKKIKVAS